MGSGDGGDVDRSPRLPLYGHGHSSGLRLFDPESAPIRDTAAKWRAAYASLAPAAAAARAEAARAESAPPTALILAHEAARIVSEAHAALRLPSMHVADCKRGRGAFHADTLLNYLRSVCVIE